MINEIRQEINLSHDLEKKINWAVKYASKCCDIFYLAIEKISIHRFS